MMKRFLIGLGIAVVAVAVFAGTFTSESAVKNRVEAKTHELREKSNGSKFIRNEVVSVVEKHGFQVLDNGDKQPFSTIVTEVQDNDTDGDGYVMATNLFDNADEVAIDKGDLKAGDIVLVTFEHDDVAKVEKNTLNIGDKVKGQVVEKDAYSYKVTEINGDEINGVAIDHVSFENAGVVLSKEYNNVPEVKVGDVVKVTYGEAFDDIINVDVN